MLYSMPRRVAILCGVFLAVVGPLVVSGSLYAATVVVQIGSTLDPQTVTIEAGNTVVWTNNDAEEHRMRSTSGPAEFDSGNLESGESWSFTFTVVGTYTYSDHRDDENPNYYGTVVVTAAGGTTTTTTAPPADPPPADPPPSGAGDVSMANRAFTPSTLTISAGSTVTWINDDDDDHTVTANDASFNSGTMGPGATYSRTFPAAGTFAYFCVFHADMTGTIVVTGSGDTPVTTTTLPSTTTTTAPPADPPPGDAPPSTPPAPGAVNIVDLAFSPASLTVGAGATVTWANTGALPHTVTGDDGSFDSGFMFTGDTFSRTFTTAGTFGSLCTLHPEMVGTIVVTAAAGDSGGAAGGSPPATAAPAGGDSAATSGTIAGSTSGTSTGGGATVSGTFTMGDNFFSPGGKTVTAGSTVTWANGGALPHTATSRSGAFDSGIVMSGQTYRRTFNTPGTYEFFCTIHPEMTGTLTVTGTATGAPDEESISTTDAALLEQGLGGVPESDADQGSLAPAAAGDEADAEAVEFRIEVIDLSYDPLERTVFVGSPVRWVNTGDLPHTVTDTEGAFDSSIMAPGDEFVHTFAEVGTIRYLCTLHPGMEGTVIVRPAPAAGSAATGEPTAAAVLGINEAASGGDNVPPLAAAGMMAGVILVIGVAMAFGMARFGKALEAEEH